MLFYQWFRDALKSLLIQNKLKYIAKEQYLRVLEVSLTAKKILHAEIYQATEDL